MQNVDLTSLLFYGGLTLLVQILFIRWAFWKKGIIKIYGVFLPFPEKEKIFSFFYFMRDEYDDKD